MRRLLLLAAGLLAAATASAAQVPVQGEERARLLERFAEQQRGVSALRAAVVERKRHPSLKGEVVRTGTLLLERPDRLRWELDGGPDRLIAVVDGPQLLVYRPERREAERHDLRYDFAARGAFEFLTAGLTAPAALEKRFELAVSRDDGRTLLTLTPRSRFVAQVVASILIVQEDGDPAPAQLVIVGARGDRTEIRLSEMVVNPPLPADAFALTLGPGVRVVEFGKGADGTESGH